MPLTQSRQVVPPVWPALVVTALAVPLVAWCAAPAVCDPRAFGAKGDGSTKDTKAFQSAIDECARKGGGTVQVGAGTYLLAPVALKSHVALQLAKGATLRASTDFADYPIPNDGTWIWQGVQQPRPIALLHAEKQADIRIFGEGVVDGAGEAWWAVYREHRKAGQPETPRPWLVQFTHCQHVVVEGITLRDSPAYTLVPYFSSDITIRNIRIFAPPDSPNTDGIAPYSSHHVRISETTIDTGDDNVAIKSSRPANPAEDSSCYDVTVSHCVFLHGHGATIGADTGGGVHDILMENLQLKGTQYGLRIKSGRGFAGEVHHITYRDIELDGANPAITISAYYPNVPAEDTAQPLEPATPRFHDITYSRVKAVGGKQAGQIVGLPESPILNLLLEDVTISAVEGIQVRNATLVLRKAAIQAQTGPSLIREANARITEGN